MELKMKIKPTIVVGRKVNEVRNSVIHNMKSIGYTSSNNYNCYVLMNRNEPEYAYV